jgi:hypothetical protein
LSGLFLAVFDPDGQLALNEAEAIARVEILLSREISDRLVILVLAAIYRPFSGQTMRDTEKGNRLVPVVQFVIARTLRFPNRHGEEAAQILGGVDGLAVLEKPLTRLKIGRWVRKVGPLWSYVHLVVFDQESFEFCVNEVYAAVRELDLVSAWEMKPLLNGIELAEAHGVKPGRGLKDLIDRLIDWQFENPLGKADDYLEFVRSRGGEGTDGSDGSSH